MHFFQNILSKFRIINRDYMGLFDEYHEVEPGTIAGIDEMEYCPVCGEYGTVSITNYDYIDEYCTFDEINDCYCQSCGASINNSNNYLLEKVDSIPIFEKTENKILEMW